MFSKYKTAHFQLIHILYHEAKKLEFCNTTVQLGQQLRQATCFKYSKIGESLDYML